MVQAWDMALKDRVDSHSPLSWISAHKISPKLIVKWKELHEQTATDYVRRHTRIPVPQVRHRYLDEWLVSDFIEGVMLFECWERQTAWMKFRIACTIRSYLKHSSVSLKAPVWQIAHAYHRRAPLWLRPTRAIRLNGAFQSLVRNDRDGWMAHYDKTPGKYWSFWKDNAIACYWARPMGISVRPWRSQSDEYFTLQRGRTLDYWLGRKRILSSLVWWSCNGPFHRLSKVMAYIAAFYGGQKTRFPV